LSNGESVVANFDDHSFLLSLDSRINTDATALRAAFNPLKFTDDLRKTLSSTETLGTSFRHIAEIGQLLPRRTTRGNVSAKASTWNASLLYTTLREHEPDHPLLKEAVREVMEDQCDVYQALEEAGRIYETPIEVYDLPRPSPFGLPLFAAFNREVLLAADPDRALDDLVAAIYEKWAGESDGPEPVRVKTRRAKN
jgi:ATP-dependent Lhr-like helicase